MHIFCNMIPLLGETDLSTGLLIVFALCLFAVVAFEFVNGFHDTANAVATVIYTKALKPIVAIPWSGFWNFLGVFAGGIAVAMGILKLVPLDTLMALPGFRRRLSGPFCIIGCYYLEFGDLVFWYSLFEFTYLDWCPYRGWYRFHLVSWWQRCQLA